VPHQAPGDSLAKVVRTDHKPVDVHDAVCLFVRDGPRQPHFQKVTVEWFTASPEGIGPGLQRRPIAGAYEFGLNGVQGPLQSCSSWLRPSWYRVLGGKDPIIDLSSANLKSAALRLTLLLAANLANTNLTEADLTDAMGVTNEALQHQAASL